MPGLVGYYVTNDGRLWSARSGKWVRPAPDRQGYLMFNIRVDGRTTTRKAHRLVALAWLPGPEQRVVMHIDDNPANNHVSNLVWGSYQDNHDDMWRKGRAGDSEARRAASVKAVETKRRRGSTKSSRFVGVSRASPGTWIVVIKKGGERLFYQSFRNEEEAARARDAAALRIFGPGTKLNFPEAASAA